MWSVVVTCNNAPSTQSVFSPSTTLFTNRQPTVVLRLFPAVVPGTERLKQELFNDKHFPGSGINFVLCLQIRGQSLRYLNYLRRAFESQSSAEKNRVFDLLSPWLLPVLINNYYYRHFVRYSCFHGPPPLARWHSAASPLCTSCVSLLPG